MSFVFRATEFIKQKIKEYNPLITTRRGSAVFDFLVAIPSILLEQYFLDLEDSVGDGVSIMNYESMSENAMDDAVGNLLVERRLGSNGAQTARMLVAELIDYNFGEGEIFALDGEGNEWSNSSTISITAEELVAQRDGIFYYIDLEFTSSEEISDLSLIESLDPDSEFDGFVSISGVETSFTDGVEKETNEQLFFRASNSVAVRDLVTNKGIRSILSEQYGNSFVDISPIGMGDEEMMRDIVYDLNGNKINLHLGGYTDIFLKTPKLSEKYSDIINLSLDTDREYTRDYSFKALGAGVPVYIGKAQLISVNSIKTTSGGVLNPSLFTIDLLLGTVAPNFFTIGTYVVNVTYNPIAIDIQRNPTPGRELCTISDLAFIKVISIEELDPGSGEPTGVSLTRSQGFGMGPFGMGPFGVGWIGDWRLLISNPHDRFSMLEESIIEFEYGHLGKDVRVTYYCAPELANIHDFCRNDNERVTSADILPRNFIPIFINGSIDVSTPASNSNAMSSDEIVDFIENYIRNYGNDRKDFELELIIAELFANGIVSIKKDYEWSGEVHHLDGQIEIVKSDTKLEIPTPVPFPKDTNRPISQDTARFYPGNISVNLTIRSDL